MKRQMWTPGQLEELTRRFPHESTAVIAADMGRGYAGVAAKARLMGLSKSVTYLADPVKSGRLDGKRGAVTRFQKGHGTWNKGREYCAGGRCPETQFKPGERPHNEQPIGTEVKTRDGYWKRKIRDDAPAGQSRFNWKFVHLLTWEEAHGPIPADHLVTFRDGNRDHLALENLQLVTKADHARRNSIHRYPEELKQTFRLVGKLKKEIRRHEKQN